MIRSLNRSPFPVPFGWFQVGWPSDIAAGEANRGVAHATSGQLLQQNLVCVLEGE